MNLCGSKGSGENGHFYGHDGKIFRMREVEFDNIGILKIKGDRKIFLCEFVAISIIFLSFIERKRWSSGSFTCTFH